MLDVVTLLSDGQTACWNLDAISGIQLWPLLMATRAPSVAKKLCWMETLGAEPVCNTLFWSHIHFVHESIGHILGLLGKEKSTDIQRVDHCVECSRQWLKSLNTNILICYALPSMIIHVLCTLSLIFPNLFLSPLASI